MPDELTIFPSKLNSELMPFVAAACLVKSKLNTKNIARKTDKTSKYLLSHRKFTLVIGTVNELPGKAAKGTL